MKPSQSTEARQMTQDAKQKVSGAAEVAKVTRVKV